MNIQEFVSETLQQIVRGVIDAQTKLADTPAAVSPRLDGGTLTQTQRAETNKDTWTLSQNVEFDLAVTALESQGSGGKMSVSVFAVSAGIGGESSKGLQSVSRVKFVVPIALPPQSRGQR